MIGCGDVTEVKSAPAFNRISGSQLVAVMARTPERVRDYAARHGVPRWYTDAHALLADPGVDAIYIATPHPMHARWAIAAAAAAGKPVYVEKPMASTVAECRRMMAACAAKGVPLFVAYYRRCQARFLKVKELLDAGVIGEVRLVRIALWLPPRPEDLQRNQLPWRVLPEIAGGGYFHDMASHQLDLLDFWFGPLRKVTGCSSNQAGLYPADDLVTAGFELAHGAVGQGSWCFTTAAAAQTDRTEIIGSKGLIRFACFEPTPVELHTAAGVEHFDLVPPQPVAQPLIERVVAALQGRGSCPSTGESALRTSTVMEAICRRE
jgi:predicted dehydrogenase